MYSFTDARFGLPCEFFTGEDFTGSPTQPLTGPVAEATPLPSPQYLECHVITVFQSRRSTPSMLPGRCCMHREPPDGRELGRSLEHTGTSWIFFPGSGVAEYWPSDGTDEKGPSGCSPHLVDVHGNPMGLALVQPSLGDLSLIHI